MFGDIGHGGLLFIFGMYLVLWHESIGKDKDHLFKELVPLRYMILMMG